MRAPLDSGESATFADIEKSIALLASGYLVGKIDTLLTPMFKGERDAVFVSRLLIAVASFVIAFIATFMSRAGYVR